MTKASESRKARKAAEAAIANTVTVSLNSEVERWSEYELSDGNKLRIKPVILEVRKGGEGPDGNPQYHLRSSMLIDVQVPPKPAKK